MIILRLQQLLLLYYIYNYTHMYTVYISNQLLGLFRNRNPHRQCLRLHDAPGCCPTELVISTHQKGLSFPNFDAKKQDTFEVFLDIHPSSSIFPAFSHHFPTIPSNFPAFSQHFPTIFQPFPAISQHFPSIFPACSVPFPIISPDVPPGLVSGPMVAAPILEVPSAAPGLTVEMELELVSDKELMGSHRWGNFFWKIMGNQWSIGECFWDDLDSIFFDELRLRWLRYWKKNWGGFF